MCSGFLNSYRCDDLMECPICHLPNQVEANTVNTTNGKANTGEIRGKRFDSSCLSLASLFPSGHVWESPSLFGKGYNL